VGKSLFNLGDVVKNLLFKIFFSVLVMTIIYGQDWEVVKQANITTLNVRKFKMFDQSNGAVIGRTEFLKTTDGGLTWTIVYQNPEVAWNSGTIFDDSVAYTGGLKGYIYKTVNGGIDWTMVGDTANFGAEGINDIDAVTADTVYAVTNKGSVLKTTDGGQTWVKVPQFTSKALMHVAFASTNVGVVASNLSTTVLSWYTVDGGNTWTEVSLAEIFPSTCSPKKLVSLAAYRPGNFLFGGSYRCKFFSSDSGKTYARIGDSSSVAINLLTAQIINPNTMITCGDNGLVQLSTDGGASWSDRSIPCSQTINRSAYFLNSEVGIVLSQYSGQWFRTINGGITWIPINLWPWIEFSNIVGISNDKLFATGADGGEIAVSTNLGISWNYPDNSLVTLQGGITECKFINQDVGYIATSVGELYKTTNGGLEWSFISSPFYENAYSFYSFNFINEDTLFAGSKKGSLIYSYDGGASWTETTLGSNIIYDIWPLSGTRVLLVGSSGAFWVFDIANNILTSNAFGTVNQNAIAVRDNVVIVISKPNIFRTTLDQLDTLTAVYTSDNSSQDEFWDIEFFNDSLVYAVGEGGIILKSSDTGLTWTKEDSITNSTYRSIYAGEKSLWAAGDNGIIIKLDLGYPEITITEAIADANADFIPDRLDQKVTVKGFVSTPNFSSAGMGYGLQDQSAGIYLSASSALATLNPGDEVEVGGIIKQVNGLSEISPITGEDIIILSTGNQLDTLLITIADIGESFENRLVIIKDVRLTEGSTWPLEGSDKDLTVTDSTDTLVMRIDQDTDLDGWAEPPTLTFDLIGIITQSTTKIPADDGYQIMPRFQADIHKMGDDAVEPDAMPRTFALYQNYPNPFNPTTTISFDLPEDVRVNLVVFNMLGQQVAILKNEPMLTGSYNINFNASNLASGIYFYRIQAGVHQSWKKMMILK
jgi:photosystem II stability/assembly factor-like uncharacterized protein